MQTDKQLKAVILAGGFGTRLSEHTHATPKPMLTVGEEPMLVHIIRHLTKFGIKEFYIAGGYRSTDIIKYFSEAFLFGKSVKLKSTEDKVESLQKFDLFDEEIEINIIDTGVNTQTGGRVSRLRRYLKNSRFILTYGDGLSNVDINSLFELHTTRSATVTITAVRPVARFGCLKIKGDQVLEFAEKRQSDSGLINGGFMLCEPKIFDYLQDDEQCILEREPLENIAANGEMCAYQHTGFWQCVDTKRDLDYLNELWSKEDAKWMK